MLKHIVGLAVVASVLLFGLESVVLAGDSKATTVRVVDKAGFDAEIALHKGKIVLVDCWATWCVPCVKEFPKTVAMSHDFADKGLVVISLSFDELADGKVPTARKSCSAGERVCTSSAAGGCSSLSHGKAVRIMARTSRPVISGSSAA